MRSVQIKNVPDDVHAVLRRRAAEAGQSLQEYLLVLLSEHAGQPTLDEVLDSVSGLTGGNFSSDFVVTAIRADRDSR
jgi:hypothetical protein